MLTGHSVVYFAPSKWDGLWRNRQQLMSVFARQNRVLFVERRLYLWETLARFRRRDLRMSDLFRSSVRQISENLFVFRYPAWAPISGCFPLDRVTRAARRLSIRNAMNELHMSQPIVWLSKPGMVTLMDEIPPAALLIYHAVDEYTTYTNQTQVWRHQVRELEREMMTRVDVVVVVSRKLYEAKCPFNPNTYLVPNGVDYQGYTAALADPHLPDDLRAISPPRLGYIGLVGDKLDLAMLRELAEENPEWSLVLLGEVSVSQQAEAWQALRALPNVHHLGPVEAFQVPQYVKGFQVGLMPYLNDRHAEYISPLKLYDYLAAGLPVASTDIPAAHEFGEYIHQADSPQDFSQAVRAALADTAPEHRCARRAIAAQHTWEARVEQLSHLIEAHLVARASPNQQAQAGDAWRSWSPAGRKSTR